MDVSRRTIYLAAGLALVIAAAVGYLNHGRKVEPTRNERAALDWVFSGTRTERVFPDQGMPEDPRPLYVVFDQDSLDMFHIVFEESDSLYTGRYRRRPEAAPKLVDLRFGYGWFDLSEPRNDLRVWRLHGGTWEFQPEAVESVVGARFDVDTYNVAPSQDKDEPRHMYVEGSGSNIGDTAGRTKCYLVYGSQMELIEGDYLSETVEPGETLVVSGVVMFPKPPDDKESGGLECEPQTGG